MNFYVLKPVGGLFGRHWAYAQTVQPRYGDCERCPQCGGAVSALRWLPPHRVTLSSAKPEKWADLVWGAGPLLLSVRFKHAYDTARLVGIRAFGDPAEIVRVGTKKIINYSLPLPPLPVYRAIEVPWGGANQDDIASGVEYERPEQIRCSYCRAGLAWRKQPKVVIDESSWNGTDIFVSRGTPARFVVSERFKQMVESYRLTNAMLIPAEKYGYDERRPGLWYTNE